MVSLGVQSPPKIMACPPNLPSPPNCIFPRLFPPTAVYFWCNLMDHCTWRVLEKKKKSSSMKGEFCSTMGRFIDNSEDHMNNDEWDELESPSKIRVTSPIAPSPLNNHQNIACPPRIFRKKKCKIPPSQRQGGPC